MVTNICGTNGGALEVTRVRGSRPTARGAGRGRKGRRGRARPGGCCAESCARGISLGESHSFTKWESHGAWSRWGRGASGCREGSFHQPLMVTLRPLPSSRGSHAAAQKGPPFPPAPRWPSAGPRLLLLALLRLAGSPPASGFLTGSPLSGREPLLPPLTRRRRVACK